MGFFFPVVTIPFVSGILGLKTNPKSFYIPCFLTLVTYFLCQLYFKLDYLTPLISLGVNFVSFFITNVITNKGFAFVKREEDKEDQIVHWIPTFTKIKNAIFNIIPTPSKLYNLSRREEMKNGSQNMIFGIYACINFILPYFLWDHEDPAKYELMTNLRFVGGVMAGLLIVKDAWNDFFKPYFHLFWHLTLLYSLPFIATVMFLLTKGDMAWLMNIGISIFFLIMLTSNKVFLILSPLGTILGIYFYKYFVGPIEISSFGFEVNYHLVYQIIFPTSIGLLFAYRKKIISLIRGSIGINLGSSLCHEVRNTLYSLSQNQINNHYLKEIKESGPVNVKGEEVYLLNKKTFDRVMETNNVSIDSTKDTVKVVKTFEDLFKNYKEALENPNVYSMKNIVDYTLQELHFNSGEVKKINTELKSDFYVKAPKEIFGFVISNIIRNAFKHGGASKINITIDNHKLIIHDNGRGISSEDMPKIFDMHFTNGDKTSTGIGLGFVKMIVNSCYAEIWCESEQGKNSYTEFIIQFPDIEKSDLTPERLKEIEKDIEELTRKREKEDTIKRMLKNKYGITQISDITDLSEGEIRTIMRKLRLKEED
jgi:Histidine kinase-, DNA gyrase B-, and HSP90-like ATPase